MRPSQSSAPVEHPEVHTGPTPPLTCKKVTIVYVGGFIGSLDSTRGAWATDPLKDKLKSAGLEVTVDNSVRYPVMSGQLPNEKGTDQGRDAVVKKLNELSEDGCLALVGYSAGDVAIKKALSDPHLKPAVASRIRAVELFGDPVNLVGVLPGVVPHPIPQGFTGRTIMKCNKGDILCDPGERSNLSFTRIAKGLLPHAAQVYGGLPLIGGPAADAATAASCLVATGKPCTTVAVAAGDTLSGLAKKIFDDAAKWRMIYDESRSMIEKAARDHGFVSSDSGHWIFPGTNLKLPAP